jgi:alpha-tubulin suppressor-like RCC1 family protein
MAVFRARCFSGFPAQWIRLAAIVGCICAVVASFCTGPAASAAVPQTLPGTPTGWGVNSLGAFGAPTSDGPTPVQITSEAGTTQVSMGCSHALYLHSDGTVWASGWNTWGQLGDGNSTSTTTATQVAGLTSVIAVAAGCYHSVALKSDGTVWIWGQNQGVSTSNPPDGTCPGFGGGGVPCFLHPAQWVGPSGITQIAAGTLDEVALASDGTVYTGGQIGNAHLTLPDPVTDVEMQDYAAEAITATGQVYSWGTSNRSPALVPGISGFATALGGGSLSGYAVTSDGAVWAWGDDRYGQLGDGKTASEATAIKVPGLPSIVAVAGGFYHAVALDASGGVWAWGDNVDGEVGPQQPQAVGAAPSQVPGISRALAITAGGYSTIALINQCAGSQLALAPALQHRNAGTDATVTATYANSCGDPLAGATVAFTVSSGPDAGVAGTGVTDASGQATFSYQGNAAGADTVGASVTSPAGAISSNSVQVVWDQVIPAGWTTASLSDSSGNPVSGASVVFRSASGSVTNATTGADGTTGAALTPGSSYSVTMYYATGYQTKTITVTTNGPNAVSFATVAVTAVISDPNGADLAAASVAHAGNPGSFGPKTAVDGSGQVVFQVLPGTNSFTAWDATGYQTKTVTITGPATVSFATVAVTVTVVKNGTPLTTASVAHAGNTGSFGPKTAVDGGGQVVFQVLPGTNTFTAWDASAYASQTLTITGTTSTSISVP